MLTSNIKLVIWDLDETFWKGTLSEEEVEPIERNIQLVKNLTDRGIVNSIVSKNDYEKAMSVLKEWDIADYFIFPHISWEPKGENVMKLLRECSLRAKNTVFIDDNHLNREEVKFYNPEINCYDPSFLDETDILSMKEFKGKDDRTHSRLKQYHILEKRAVKSQSFASNEDFLRASHIVIEINKECQKHISRIEELIQRSNQLNYTKNRMEIGTLSELLQKSDVDAALISARDDFGEYGVIGFYLKKNEQIIHFLFSCRTLGFGIENYVWAKLGYPEIEVIGEVATSLDRDKKIDWIQEKEVTEIDENFNSDNKEGILFIGGCDLEQASRYLESSFSVKKEFATVVDGHEVRTSDTLQLIGAKELDRGTKEELCKNIPFFDKDITFATELYSGRYKIVIISVVDDFIRAVYKKKDSDLLISYGGYWHVDEELRKNFTDNELQYFYTNFKNVGCVTTELFKDNLEKIVLATKGSKLIFINGIELDVSDWIGEERCKRNVEMNRIIDEVIKKHPEIGLVDMRKIVTSREQLPSQDNRHYDRKSYYIMAEEIIKQIMEVFGDDKVTKRSMMLVATVDTMKRVKNNLERIFKK